MTGHPSQSLEMNRMSNASLSKCETVLIYHFKSEVPSWIVLLLSLMMPLHGCRVWNEDNISPGHDGTEVRLRSTWLADLAFRSGTNRWFAIWPPRGFRFVGLINVRFHLRTDALRILTRELIFMATVTCVLMGSTIKKN